MTVSKEENLNRIGLTYEQIGELEGLSRTRIKEIEERALRKMAKHAKALGMTFDPRPGAR